jgi:hypothetical protein
MKYVLVIVIAVLVVLGGLLINMSVNHGCLPWERAERSPPSGPGMEWECR